MTKTAFKTACLVFAVCVALCGCSQNIAKPTDSSEAMDYSSQAKTDETSTTASQAEANTDPTRDDTITASEPPENNCDIFVDEQELSSAYSAYMNTEKEYALLPFTQIIQALGGRVTQKTDSEVLIQLDEKNYCLDPFNNTLKDTDSGKDYFQTLGDSTHCEHFRSPDNEYMVDSNCLQYFFLDANILMKSDFNTLAVFISKKVPVPHEENNCTVFVDDRELSSEYYAYINDEQEYAALPFTQIIQALGGSVTWQTDFEALIELDGKEYVLDVLNTTLTDTESEKDYLQLILGGTTHYPYFRFTGDDYIMDSDYISYFFSDTNIRMTMDVHTSTVYIDRITHDTNDTKQNLPASS